MQEWIMIALLGDALLVGSPATLAQRDDPDALKKQVEQLQQRVDELEKKASSAMRSLTRWSPRVCFLELLRTAACRTKLTN